MKLKSPLSTIIAIGSGFIVLLTYIVNIEEIVRMRSMLISWIVIVSAGALLIGLINLLLVHINKFRKDKKSFNSLVLLASALITFSLTMVFGSNHSIPKAIFEYVHIPIETSLMAVLAVTLTFAGARLLNKRPSFLSIAFILHSNSTIS